MFNCKNNNEIVSYKELIIGTWKNDYNLDKDSLKYFVPQSKELRRCLKIIFVKIQFLFKIIWQLVSSIHASAEFVVFS